VDTEEYRVKSRMLAYERVGQMVGMSGSWIRKFIKQYDGVGLDYVVGMNIRASYERLCERIERDADRRMRPSRETDQGDRQMDLGATAATTEIDR
jgi:hypothetical protein